MQILHKEILTEQQITLLPLLGKFSRTFGLVGGTAIALYLGHRRSIDFDMFTNKPFSNLIIRRKIQKFYTVQKVFKDEDGQYTFFINNVQLTFFHYPYKLKFNRKFENFFRLPDLLTLAAMKAFALGRRAKWKDFVDLYFIIGDGFSVSQISRKGEQIFGNEFNEKLFRNQLAYFDDIDYTEEVIYMDGFETENETIKKKLIECSLR